MSVHLRLQAPLRTVALSKYAAVCIIWAGLASCERVLANEPASSAFDIETLKSRGIDPKLAELFAQSSRFLPGQEEVGLFVNGERIGSLKSRFDAQGDLCFDQQLLDKAGLIVPDQTVVLEASASPMIGENPEPAVAGVVSDAAETKASATQSSRRILAHATGPVSFWAARSDEARSIENESTADAAATSQCYNFVAAYPQTEVDLRPGKQEVHLFVPQEALRPAEKDFSNYSNGGVASLLNYDTLTMKSQSPGMKMSYSSLSTEAGLNIGDWALRSRQNLIDQNGDRSNQHLYTYAQRTFLPLRSIVQVGQIDIASPIFAGASITGLQLLPDTTLTPEGIGGATIEGIAQTSQARVEVKQDGLLIHTEVVPVGAFVLQNIPLIRGNSNVDVTIFESDGSEHSFSVPAASLRRVNFSTTGLSLAVGKVRQVGDSTAQEPDVITLSNDWLVSHYSMLTTGVMLSADYTAAGMVVDSMLGKDTTLSVANVVSQAKDEGKRGIQSSIAANTRLAERVTASASVMHQSKGYRDLLDTTEVDQPFDLSAPNEQVASNNKLNRANTQLSANLSLSTQRLGGGSVGFVQSKSADGDWGRMLSLSWAKNFKGATLSATYQKDMAGDVGNAAFLSLSVPLDESRSMQARVSRSGDSDTRIGTTYNDSVNDALSYSLSASQQGSGNGTDLAGSLSATPRYSQVNLGYAQDGSGRTSYNAGARGALVLHRDGITPSPHQVQDTFGIVSVGDEAGIKIHTPNGTVWTDAGGRAVISQLSSYRANRVEVATNTLPRNVDIDNGYKNIEVGRGSVSRIDFDVVKVRRVLLSAQYQDGGQLPKGASVLDKDGSYLTMVVDDGKIFLDDASKQSLVVNLPGGDQCSLEFKLPEIPDLESYYEQTSAVCA